MQRLLAFFFAAALLWTPAWSQSAPDALVPDLSQYILTPPAPPTPRINGAKVFGARPGSEFLFGMGIILLCMVFNIINSFKTHDVEKTWFDTNAVAGLVFYGSAVLCIGLFVSGHAVPGGAVLAIMFGLPLLLIFFKEPLTNLVEKKVEVMPKEKGMFIVQGIFELFEVILSYFSNTLSFVRIGAFAVSHAAMMEVVLMLAGAENGSPNWIVIILGNLFVCAMEGLIVGIQVLRLEYYEMFSRFYKGSGRKFEPFCSKNK